MPTSPRLLAGLIGAGISASLTPAMHEREARAQGLPAIYTLIDLTALNLTTASLPDLLLAAERMGFTGLNITHPCKQAIIPLLDDISPHAKALGAVNTVLLREGKRIGHNTDWVGYAENTNHFLKDAPLHCAVQLGAGGGGSAVAYALLHLGLKHLILHDTDPAKAAETATRLAPHFPASHISISTDLPTEIAAADGLINCTPIGMASHPGTPLDPGLLHSALWVSEIIYFPLETELLRHAKALGCRTLNGGGMAVFQAVEAFRLFTNLKPNTTRMLAHFADMTG